MIKTKIWVLIILSIFSISLLTGILLLTLPKNNVVELYSDGELVYSFDLSTISDPITLTIQSENGFNEILIEHGRIRVTNADCNDRSCINSGWFYGGITPVVCLPHRLIIKSVSRNNGDYDLITG